MMGDDKFVCREDEAAVAAVRRGVSEEDTCGRARSEFVSCGSGEVRVTKTSENPKLVERKREAIENLVWGAVLKGFSGVKVEQESGSVKSFDPIYWRHACLEKK
jgi:hypothetical protein